MALNHYVMAAGVSTFFLLLATYYQLKGLSGLLKTITSLILWFYGYALYNHQPSTYAQLILLAISLGVIGDILLIGKGSKYFIGGMFAFGLGHLAYSLAFWRFSFDIIEWLVVIVILAAVMFRIYRWLAPKIPDNMKLAVTAYMSLLGLMCSMALSARFEGQLTLVAMGATLFMISDLFVATYRFNKPQLSDKLVGLPLYFAGQFILATSILQLTTDSPWLPV